MEIKTRRNLILTFLSTLSGLGIVASFLNLPADLNSGDVRTGLVFVILFLFFIFVISTVFLLIRLWSDEE